MVEFMIQTGQTGHYPPGNLCRAAFAILAMFGLGTVTAISNYDQNRANYLHKTPSLILCHMHIIKDHVDGIYQV